MSGKIQEVIKEFEFERDNMRMKKKPITDDDFIKLIRIDERICRLQKLLILINEIEYRSINYLSNKDYNNEFFGNRPMIDILIDRFFRDCVVGAYA